MDINQNLEEDNNRENININNDIERLNDQKILKKQWREEIANNEGMQKYFATFKNWSIDSFIDNYISEKYLIHIYGDMYRDIVNRKRDQYINDAHEALEAIQQKKLFDQQCLWRAEQVIINEIEIAYDFEYWENYVIDCPFLEPISMYDIDMYQRYLLSDNVDIDNLSFNEWQNYDEIKNAYDNDNEEFDEIPEWYEYHNTMTGSSSMMLLPNIRGDKEEFYIDLYHKKDRIENPYTETEYELEQNSKPVLESGNKQNIKYFIDTFEDKELQKKYNYYIEGNTYQDADKEHMTELIFKILDVNEPIPIEANYDMLDAIKKAYTNYQLRKISEHLPIAYEQYLFNRQMGFSSERKDVFKDEIRKIYYNQIIAGRIINGEEANLDF